MLKESLQDSWSFFSRNIMAIASIILPIIIPVEILTSLYTYSTQGEAPTLGSSLVMMVVWGLSYSVYMVAVIFYISSTISGQTLSTKALWRQGAQVWGRYFLLILLVGAMVLVGFMALIVPGIIFMIRYAFAEFELLLNQKHAIEALKSSWHATADYVWAILGGYAVISLALWLPYLLIVKLLTALGLNYDIAYSLLDTASSVFGVFYTIFAFRIYEYYRSEQAGMAP
ncbi:YciC family protein [Marinobacter caseinilyticus]|uniref:YciC family protein n=1 Tax=Marinobacter caseinilyticus TaxID=2692195 RepID=UPI0014084E2C|nr:YciC family protein [Marinobacter caseinilyticus]